MTAQPGEPWRGALAAALAAHAVLLGWAWGMVPASRTDRPDRTAPAPVMAVRWLTEAPLRPAPPVPVPPATAPRPPAAPLRLAGPPAPVIPVAATAPMPAVTSVVTPTVTPPMPSTAAPGPPSPPAPVRLPDPAPTPRPVPADHAGCADAPHPLALRERGIEGVVRLRVQVDREGRAREAQVLDSSGWRLFDEAALAQARRCRFRPAHDGTTAVESWVEFPVRFALTRG